MSPGTEFCRSHKYWRVLCNLGTPGGSGLPVPNESRTQRIRGSLGSERRASRAAGAAGKCSSGSCLRSSTSGRDRWELQSLWNFTSGRSRGGRWEQQSRKLLRGCSVVMSRGGRWELFFRKLPRGSLGVVVPEVAAGAAGSRSRGLGVPRFPSVPRGGHGGGAALRLGPGAAGGGGEMGPGRAGPGGARLYRRKGRRGCRAPLCGAGVGRRAGPGAAPSR